MQHQCDAKTKTFDFFTSCIYIFGHIIWPDADEVSYRALDRNHNWKLARYGAELWSLFWICNAFCYFVLSFSWTAISLNGQLQRVASQKLDYNFRAKLAEVKRLYTKLVKELVVAVPQWQMSSNLSTCAYQNHTGYVLLQNHLIHATNKLEIGLDRFVIPMPITIHNQTASLSQTKFHFCAYNGKEICSPSIPTTTPWNGFQPWLLTWNLAQWQIGLLECNFVVTLGAGVKHEGPHSISTLKTTTDNKTSFRIKFRFSRLAPNTFSKKLTLYIGLIRIILRIKIGWATCNTCRGDGKWHKTQIHQVA